MEGEATALQLNPTIPTFIRLFMSRRENADISRVVIRVSADAASINSEFLGLGAWIGFRNEIYFRRIFLNKI